MSFDLDASGKWRDTRSRSFYAECARNGISFDALIYYDAGPEYWRASLQFNLVTHQFVRGGFEAQRFEDRESAKRWCERMIDANLPLLAALPEVQP